MASWVRPKNLLWQLQCAYSFSESTKKEVLNEQGAWHSPKTLNHMVHGHAFDYLIIQIDHQWLSK